MKRKGKIILEKTPLERMRTYTQSNTQGLNTPKRETAEAEDPQPAADVCGAKAGGTAPAASPAPGSHAAYRTDVGLVRELNEDSVLIAAHIYGVADGMGGHNAGEVASGRTRDMLLERLAGREADPDALRSAVEEINQALFESQQADKSISGMGTTLTVLWEGKEHVYIAHVGDSRAYLFRDGKLEQMTTDHSYVEEMVQHGLLTREQAAVSPLRNVITRAIATEEGIEVDILKEEKQVGDTWLLCSDGLHGMVKRQQISEILKRSDSLEEKAEALLQAALAGGGTDNVSLVLWSPGEGEL